MLQSLCKKYCDILPKGQLQPKLFSMKQGCYGTRSMAALSVKASGTVSLYEKYLEENIWKKHTIQYQIEKVCCTKDSK